MKKIDRERGRVELSLDADEKSDGHSSNTSNDSGSTTGTRREGQSLQTSCKKSKLRPTADGSKMFGKSQTFGTRPRDFRSDCSGEGKGKRKRKNESSIGVGSGDSNSSKRRKHAS